MGFNDANALLQTGGDPIAKFNAIGDSITGILVDAEVVDQTTPQGEVVTDTKTGRVKKQIVYTLQTDERDAAIEDDDGKRRVFAKWAIQQAITEALQEQGLEKVGLQEGGKITITHTHTKPASTKGFSDMKLFTVKYEKPGPKGLATPSASTGDTDVYKTKEQLVAEYGQQSVDMAWQIYGASPQTPLNVIAQASNIPEADLRFALTGEGSAF
jgi:hypothetical protein